MRQPGLFLLFLLFIAGIANGQEIYEIKGEVKDTSGVALQGVTVKLTIGTDSTMAVTDKDGFYSFSKINTTKFLLEASFTGYTIFSQVYEKTGSGAIFRVPSIRLLPASKEMEGITIVSTRPVLIKEDTVQFDASAYKVREGSAAEEVLKKLPGLSVDKDGNIEAQGKKVARVRVNGKDFFGGDVQTATQNIPAELIQNIQVIDDYGDAATLNGVKTGEPEKIININTLPTRNKGSFGNSTLAGGNLERYAASTFLNNFNEDRQISFLGAINNTNANLFNFNGGGKGGGARGANYGSDSRGTNGGPGISLSKSVGINYRDKWGEKISVYGSFSFSDRNTAVNSSTFSQDINPLTIRNTQRESSNENHYTNHRTTLNVEYAMDSFNYIKVSPYVSYSAGNNQSSSLSQISRTNFFTLNNNNTKSQNHSTNAGGNFLYNHRFSHPGRNFTTNVSFDFSDNNNDRYANGSYHNIDSTQSPLLIKDTMQIQGIGTLSRNYRTNARFSYMEPLNASGKTVLEFNYEWNKSITESLRDVTDFLTPQDNTGKYNERQSNHYNYQFTTNRAGVSLRGHAEKYNYSVGMQSQPTSLTGHSVDKQYTTNYQNINWVPSMRFVYNFSRNNSLTASLEGTAREPGFNQLQPVADSSNLNNILIGNPQLQNEFTNTLSLRYNRYNSKKGNSLFVNFSYNKTSDKIVSSQLYNLSGTGRTTSYTNTDGFYGYHANGSYTNPFSNRQFVPGISFAANYDNNISFTNGLKNKGNNWNIRSGASFRLDLEDLVDVTLRADYTAYQTTTRYTTSTTTTKAQSLSYGVNGKNYVGDLTIGYEFSKLINYGFSSSVNSNPSILNVYSEYRFLRGRKLTVRLQAYDLFNKNTGIVRTVNETTITDSRTSRLGRYVLLSVNWRFSKFTGNARKNKSMRDFNNS